MATRYRDLYFTPLEPEAAGKVAGTLEDLLVPEDEPLAPNEAPPPGFGDDGANLGVMTADDLRSEDEGYLFDGDVVIAAEAGVPTEAELRARGIELDEAARERLASARSTIRVEHDARVSDAPVFVSIRRLLHERMGPSLVERPGTSTLLTSETVARELLRKRGASRLETLRTARKPPRKTRAARPGELEAVAIRTRLEECIEDPFTSDALRRALAAAAPLVQAYAALLLDEGPASDERAAKLLGVPTRDMKVVRDALHELVESR